MVPEDARLRNQARIILESGYGVTLSDKAYSRLSLDQLRRMAELVAEGEEDD